MARLTGSRAFHLVAEGQLIDKQMVLGRQLFVLQLVSNAERQLALVDMVTGIFS